MYYVCIHTDTRFLEGGTMRFFPTGEQMRRADAYTIEHIGIPSLVLMERAALECVRHMEAQKINFSNILVVLLLHFRRFTNLRRISVMIPSILSLCYIYFLNIIILQLL